jgi:hypothetical protein
MSVVLPNKYEHREKLEQRGVLCITEDEANRATKLFYHSNRAGLDPVAFT